MKFLNKIGMFCVMLFVLASASGCGVIEPGHAGLKVNMYGTDRGVDKIPIVTGRVFYNPITTRIFEYPTFVQTAEWRGDEGVTFNSKEGLIFSAEVSLSFQVNYEDVPQFYVKFRSDDINMFVHGFLRNVSRDAMNEIAPLYSAEQLYGEKKEEFLVKVRERINEEIKGYGRLVQFGFLGAPQLPKNVTDALNAKLQADQDAAKAENKVRQVEAEAEQAIARARGEAESNELVAKSISPQLVEWERLQILKAKWDGKVPQYMMGNGSDMSVLMPLPNGGNK